jgi:hypothetical protein
MTMPTCIASIFLIAAAAIQSFVCICLGQVVPQAYRSLYHLKSLEEERVFIPAITLFASDHSWLIALALATVCAASIAALRRFPEKTVPCMTVGLCAQGLVTWSAMFCFCFEGFTGAMCLHHGPEFEFFQFVSFGAGVFPITLLLIVVPMIAAFSSGTISRRESS